MSADPRQVPTLPVTVEVGLVTGRTMRVTLFLSIESARREGPETLDEFLNTARRLLPVSVRDVPPSADPSTADGDKRELLAREAIVTVRVTSDIAPRAAEEVAPAIDLVKVELAGGKILDGAVRHDAGTRLSDFFNAAPDFFAVEDTGGVVWVNKRHLVSISM